MLTRKRFALPRETGDAVKDLKELGRVIHEYLLSLEQKGSLAIDQASVDGTPIGATTPSTGKFTTLEVTTSSVFPVGTFTPVLTFATAGDLAVTYSIQLGWYTRIGRLVVADFSVVTSAFTHSTASGALRITGLPATSIADTDYVATGSMIFSGITKAGYTQVVPVVTENVSLLQFTASGSGVANSTVAAADLPTGGTVRLRGSIVYAGA